MPEDRRREREGPAAGPVPGRERVVWNDDRMRTVHANTAGVTGTREEIVLRFGTERRADRSSGEASVRWSDAVTLSPHVAKRFALLLDRVLAGYEDRFGPLGPGEPARPRAEVPVQASVEALRSHSRSGRLIALVETFGVRPLFERSFKLSEGTVEPNRFLLGLPKREIGPGPQERLLHLCGQLEAPDAYLEALAGDLPDSDFVHFGFEEAGGRCLYKVYLEFSTRLEKMAENDPEGLRSMMRGLEPFLMFLGFKWNPEDARDRALTRYHWYPGLPFGDMLRRASRTLQGSERGLPFAVLEDLLGLVSERVPHDRVNYFDVVEEESGRRSFDVNVYDAKLCIGDLRSLLIRAARGLSIPAAALEPLSERIGRETLGHLSGGIDRRGRGFLTFYHGGGRLDPHDPWTGDTAPGIA